MFITLLNISDTVSVSVSESVQGVGAIIVLPDGTSMGGSNQQKKGTISIVLPDGSSVGRSNQQEKGTAFVNGTTVSRDKTTDTSKSVSVDGSSGGVYIDSDTATHNK